MDKITIDLGRDGDPDGTPASVWINITDGAFRMEVECYKEAWCDLDASNFEKLLKELKIWGESDDCVVQFFKTQFMQNETQENFEVLDKFMKMCDQFNVKYNYNSWFSMDDR